MLSAPSRRRVPALVGVACLSWALSPTACSPAVGDSADLGSETGGAPDVATGGVANDGGSGGVASSSNDGSGGSTAGGSGGAPAGTGGQTTSGGDSGSGAAFGTGGVDLGSGGTQAVQGLSWPIDWPVDCEPETSCYAIGYPDADDDGIAFDCSTPGYLGHEGTDIPVTWEQMDAGVAVRAAADGTVFFASDGKYDRCPDESEPDCQNPPSYEAGASDGTTVCTELGPYCNPPGGSCFWCFAGGNVVVVLHDTALGVFATRYDHLKNGSVLVEVGQKVTRGEQLAEVGSAGNSSGPHLHFEVWGNGYYDVIEPWVGACGPNTTASLWVTDPPWNEYLGGN